MPTLRSLTPTAALAVAIVLVSPGQAWDTEAARDLASARILESRIQGVIARTRGAVVTIVVEGVLQVPFLNIAEAGGNPSYDITDTDTAGRIGGRYDFTISVR